MKRTLTCLAVLLVAAATAKATEPDSWWYSHIAAGSDCPKYTANELGMDFFGSYINPEQKFDKLFEHNIHRGRWGGGVGLNYFFIRNLGLGVDFNASDHPGDIVDEVTGNLTLRVPICQSGFSPYIFASGGRGISPIWDWLYGGGVGLEYRFTPVIGMFSDARFLWSDRTSLNDRLLIRAGLRITF